MTEVRNITLGNDERKIAFQWSYDSNFMADLNTNYYLSRNQMPEPEMINLLLRVLRPGDRAIDVGANVGFFTLVMAALVEKTGLVEAIEPGLNNRQKLGQNLDLNQFSQAVCYQMAAWNTDEQLTLHLSQDSGNNSLRSCPDSVGVFSVAGLPLDQLDDWIAPDTVPVRMIKIDAEGAEYEILEGAQKLLRSRLPYVVVELNEVALNRFGHTREDVRALMHDRGYRMFLLHSSGAFPTFIPRNVPIKSEIHNLNVLFSTIDKVTQAWPEVVL